MGPDGGCSSGEPVRREVGPADAVHDPGGDGQSDVPTQGDWLCQVRRREDAERCVEVKENCDSKILSICLLFEGKTCEQVNIARISPQNMELKEKLLKGETGD